MKRPKFSQIVDVTPVSRFRERLKLDCGHEIEIARSRIGKRTRTICPECSE